MNNSGEMGVVKNNDLCTVASVHKINKNYNNSGECGNRGVGVSTTHANNSSPVCVHLQCYYSKKIEIHIYTFLL